MNSEYEWTCAPTLLGGDGKPDLVFVNGNPVAYFKERGASEKPTLYILQGVNRLEFRTDLFVNLPEFCKANKIDDRTILDIFTSRGLEKKAVICRVNSKSRFATK